MGLLGFHHITSWRIIVHFPESGGSCDEAFRGDSDEFIRILCGAHLWVFWRLSRNSALLVIHLTFAHLWAVHVLVPCGWLFTPFYSLGSVLAFPFLSFTALQWQICLSFAALQSPGALTSLGYIHISPKLVFAALFPVEMPLSVISACEEPCETEGFGICLIVNSNENLLEFSPFYKCGNRF